MFRTLLFLACAAPLAAATYTIDAGASKLEVTTGKAGMFKSAGHAHLIRASSFTGEVQADPAKPQNARVSITVDAASLKVVDPEASEKDRATVQGNMEGDRTLDISRFTNIKFISKKVEVKPQGGAYEVALDGLLQLHGVQKDVRVPCTVKIEGDTLTASGAVEIRQKDFGITPYSAGLGAVKVKNEVKIAFEIVAKKTSK